MSKLETSFISDLVAKKKFAYVIIKEQRGSRLANPTYIALDWATAPIEEKVLGFTNAYRGQYQDNAYPDGGKEYAVWGQQDLRFIVDNFEVFVKGEVGGELWYLNKRNEYAGFTTVGFSLQVKQILEGKAEGGALFTQAALMAATLSGIGKGRELPKNFPWKFFAENEDHLLKIVAFQRHSFNAFDLKITEKINVLMDREFFKWKSNDWWP
jgi:hypothetical protein